MLNNTYRSHEFVNILSRIEADKGIVFNYADNQKLKESGFAVEGKTVNGFVDTNTGAVTLNVQSAKSWQSVVGHEITHVLEGTDAYEPMQKTIFVYAESKGELTSRRGEVTELYKGMNADIDSELTAELIGDYLFTDKDFVTHLTTDRNLFQKIYDEIKYLYKVATGKEHKEIAKVKKEFDKAWKELNVKSAASEQKNNTADKSGVYSFGVTQDDINNYVESAYKKENTEDYKKFAQPSERLLSDVGDELDISEYTHAMRDNDIRHIRNSHGESTNEKYPVTKEDIKLIPWLVENYDKVFVKTNANNVHGIVYVKVMPDNVIYYVEAVTEEYHNEKLLVNKQMVKTGIDDIPKLRNLREAINKKESSSQYLADLKKIHEAYAQGVKENYSTNSIPNSIENVNKNSLSNEADDIAPVGDFSTPLNELYYDDFAPIRSDIAPAKAATDTNVGGKSNVSDNDDIAPAVAENVITDVPIRDDVDVTVYKAIKKYNLGRWKLWPEG